MTSAVAPRVPAAMPLLENLEDRQLLSVVTLLPSDFLDVGNRWVYTYNGTGSSGLHDLRVTKNGTWAGRACKVLRKATKINGQAGLHNVDGHYKMDATKLLDLGDVVLNSGVMRTVQGTKVFSQEPRKINTTDRNRLWSSGNYVIAGAGNGTASYKNWVSYLGRANLTLTVNGKRRTFHTIKAKVTTQITTSWLPGMVTKNVSTVYYDPAIGRVKYVDVAYINGARRGGSTTTLKTYSV